MSVYIFYLYELPLCYCTTSDCIFVTVLTTYDDSLGLQIPRMIFYGLRSFLLSADQLAALHFVIRALDFDHVGGRMLFWKPADLLDMFLLFRFFQVFVRMWINAVLAALVFQQV